MRRLGLATFLGLWLAAAVSPAAPARAEPSRCGSGNPENGRPCVVASTPDASRVLFETAQPLTREDNDEKVDIYERSGGVTRLFSVDSAGHNTPGAVTFLAASPDLERVVFSTHDGMVPADQDDQQDIYRRDGPALELVAVPGAAPCLPNGEFCYEPYFEGASGDTSRVFFSTYQSLDPADTNDRYDIYEAHAGEVKLVSTGPASGGPADAQVEFSGSSSDGTEVYFTTDRRLVAGDTDDATDLYRRAGGSTTLITPDALPSAHGPGYEYVRHVSPDGSRVYLTTGERLVPGMGDTGDTYLYRIEAGAVTLISKGSTAPDGGDGDFAAESADGGRVIFRSADALVPADQNATVDLYESVGGVVSLVSTGPRGNAGVGGEADWLDFDALASDGGVYFTTDRQLVAADDDFQPDLYLRDGSQTSLVSVATSGANGGAARFGALAAGGARVFFHDSGSLSPFDPDPASNGGLYVRTGGTTSLASEGAIFQDGSRWSGSESVGAVSSDGETVFFTTTDRLSPEDSDLSLDLYERHLDSGQTSLVSVGPTQITSGPVGGTTSRTASFAFHASDGYWPFQCSLDGGAFRTCRSPARYRGLAVGKHTFGVRAVVEGVPETHPAERSLRVVVNRPAGDRYRRVIEGVVFAGSSRDGRVAYFTTRSQLSSADTDKPDPTSESGLDIYKRAAGRTSLVSIGPAGGNDGTPPTLRFVSADGSRAIFSTSERLTADDLDDHGVDLFVREGNQTSLISAGPGAGTGSLSAVFGDASGDGRRVFFTTRERLVPSDTDDFADVYESEGTVTTLVSTGASAEGGADASLAGITPDGDAAIFLTAESFDPSDTDGLPDLYRRRDGLTTLVSTGPDGGNGPFTPRFAGLSDDGTATVFETAEPLLAADTDAKTDVYRRSGGTTALLSADAGRGNGPYDATVLRRRPVPPADSYPARFIPVLSADASVVMISSDEGLTAEDTDNGFTDIYSAGGAGLRLLSSGPLGEGLAFHAEFLGATAGASHLVFSTQERLTRSDRYLGPDIYERSGLHTRLLTIAHPTPRYYFGARFGAVADSGSPVYFTTSDSLVPADRNEGSTDIYGADGQHLWLVTRLPGGGGLGRLGARFGDISSDGSRVFFDTMARMVRSDRDDAFDVYERAGRRLILISRPAR